MIGTQEGRKEERINMTRNKSIGKRKEEYLQSKEIIMKQKEMKADGKQTI